MNVLYPNFLRKIDHYLKINYPHVWRTRVHDFLWFSLVLGNVLAVILGVFAVGRDNAIDKSGLVMMYMSLLVFLAFVFLFWVMHLIRFKLKFSDFRMLLTTWLIYVFCLLSLTMNLATFTFSVAYQTANLYSDEVLKSHSDFLSAVNIVYFNEQGYDLGECQNMAYNEEDLYLKKYYVETLTNIVSLHNADYDSRDKICEADVDNALMDIGGVMIAKKFVKQPVLGKAYFDHGEKTFYHQHFRQQWMALVIILFFAPALLFLVSTFGLINVLGSAFVGVALTVLIVFLANFFNLGDSGKVLTSGYIVGALSLKMILMTSEKRFWGWSYVGGLMLVMLGILAFMIFLMNGSWYSIYPPHNIDNLLVLMTILPVSLLVSFIGAWGIARFNNRPVLQ